MLLEPEAFIWCIAGPHIGETLNQIVERKRRDLDRFGWCLWAYGGMGNAHPETEVRRLAAEYTDNESLSLLMPDTGKKYPETGVPFTGYQVTRASETTPIPVGMSTVTGGRASWAFWITSLDWSDDAHIDIGQYVAPYSRKGPQPLPEYLRGSHGRACAARAGEPPGTVTSPGSLERQVSVVAELAQPYAVFLAR